MEMLGTWAIVDKNLKCLEIFEGDILQFDKSKYEDCGGEIGCHAPTDYRNPEVGKVYNFETDRFE